MSFAATRLLLVRHGETAANVAGRMQGRGDDPLTDLGRRQVRAVAERIQREAHPVTAVYSSPLLRARHTAELIAGLLALPLQLRDGLQEMHLGQLEGVTAAELAAATPTGPDARYPDGESAREFVERIMGTLHGLIAVHAGSTVVVVSHGGVIGTALSIWATGRGGAWREFAPANCALSILDFAHGPALVTVNDQGHLAALAEL
jgi:broad specificity phosphatase PhoE